MGIKEPFSTQLSLAKLMLIKASQKINRLKRMVINFMSAINCTVRKFWNVLSPYFR